MLLERYMNGSLAAAGGAGSSWGQAPGQPGGGGAFSLYQGGPPSALEQNPFLLAAHAAHALQTAQLHSQLQNGYLPPPAEPPLLGRAPPLAAAPQRSPRSPQGSAGSERSKEGTDDEREREMRRLVPPPGSGVAGMKVRGRVGVRLVRRGSAGCLLLPGQGVVGGVDGAAGCASYTAGRRQGRPQCTARTPWGSAAAHSGAAFEPRYTLCCAALRRSRSSAMT